MNKIKYGLAAAGLSTVLALGLAAPVAAQSNTAVGGSTANQTVTTNTDSSEHDNHSLNVNGNCSGIIQTSVEQHQHNEGDVTQNPGSLSNTGTGTGSGTNTTSNTSSNSQTSSVSNSQAANVTFSPACNSSSVTNVTQAATATTAAASPQVVAPAGGVKAGAGGATGSELGSLFGLGGSLSSLGFGAVRFLRRRSL